MTNTTDEIIERVSNVVGKMESEMSAVGKLKFAETWKAAIDADLAELRERFAKLEAEAAETRERREAAHREALFPSAPRDVSFLADGDELDAWG